MNLTPRVCGPKCSWCCTILSVWGIIQLIIMGAAIYNKNVAFIEDFVSKEEFENVHEMEEIVEESARSTAKNCWIAAGIYCGTLVLSLHQVWVNSRTKTED